MTAKRKERQLPVNPKDVGGGSDSKKERKRKKAKDEGQESSNNEESESKVNGISFCVITDLRGHLNRGGKGAYICRR